MRGAPTEIELAWGRLMQAMIGTVPMLEDGRRVPDAERLARGLAAQWGIDWAVLPEEHRALLMQAAQRVVAAMPRRQLGLFGGAE